MPLKNVSYQELFVYRVEANMINAYNSSKRHSTEKEEAVCEILRVHKLKKTPSVLYADIKQQQKNDYRIPRFNACLLRNYTRSWYTKLNTLDQ